MGGKAIAICSGGLDSTVMLYEMVHRGIETIVLSFDYGQKHKIELDYIERTAKKLGLLWILERMPTFSSALTNLSETIPMTDYDDKAQRVTVVPNRNMIMIAIAAGYAIQNKAREVWYAAHTGDHAIYPDCREEFVRPLAEALYKGTYENIILVAPFIDLTKTDIVLRGAHLGVPFQDTWSCYSPVVMYQAYTVNIPQKIVLYHCGQCGTCRERIEAFREARVADPTAYINTCGVVVKNVL